MLLYRILFRTFIVALALNVRVSAGMPHANIQNILPKDSGIPPESLEVAVKNAIMKNNHKKEAAIIVFTGVLGISF